MGIESDILLLKFCNNGIFILNDVQILLAIPADMAIIGKL